MSNYKLKLVLIFVSVLLFTGCESLGPSRNNSGASIISDNYWINNDTLQLVVTGEPENSDVPYTVQTEQACKIAEQNIKTRLLELYPKAAEQKYRTSIIRKLHTEPGHCALVTHISGSGLKRKLK
ncbi:MAG: hypothetical protein ABUK01_01520 [Leptospirales bacterium]